MLIINFLLIIFIITFSLTKNISSLFFIRRCLELIMTMIVNHITIHLNSIAYSSLSWGCIPNLKLNILISIQWMYSRHQLIITLIIFPYSLCCIRNTTTNWVSLFASKIIGTLWSRFLLDISNHYVVFIICWGPSIFKNK